MNTGFSINGDSYLLYELASIVEGTFSLSVKSGLLSGEAPRIEVRQPLSLRSSLFAPLPTVESRRPSPFGRVSSPLSLPVETDSPLIILLFLL